MKTLSSENIAQRRPKVCADDVTRANVESMRRVEEEALSRRSAADRIAAFVAGFCGSMPFVWLHVAWFCGWLTLNSWPGRQAFRPLSLHLFDADRLARSDFFVGFYPDQPEL